MEKQISSSDQKSELKDLVRSLLRNTSDVSKATDFSTVKKSVKDAYNSDRSLIDRHGINRVNHALRTAIALCEMVSPDRNMIIATLVYELCSDESLPINRVRELWGEDVERMVNGLIKVSSLYGKQGVVKTDNFRRLLMTFAEDIRVIIIMIVERLSLMRAINHHPDEKFVTDTAFEANYLYAPLAHRLGLYKIKSELEDMSLKYTARETYTNIARELKETKVARDTYIADFISPLKAKLDATGLKYEIKGRTKSIYSIWNKLRKQQVELSGIYDLFAIRIILDVPLEREKAECWNVYSIVADMYTPNPARMKDWLSIPKSNGYESLHTTVKGQGNKWVEVQIRTRRMDLVAEKGLAAHWKYKGIKSEGDLDSWMNNIRDILETADGPMELMKNFKMDLYDKEVFVFTPRGDLYRLPLGASVLDFAFNIHSKLGCTYLMRTIKKMGYKTVTDFYHAISDESIDVNDVIAQYELIEKADKKSDIERRSAEEFELIESPDRQETQSDDILIIGDNIKGINYRLSKCCNPIFGDDVFGFVSAEGVIKIHRNDCPNASHIRYKYPYRVIRTRWSGKVGSRFAATLKIIGNDDISIVTNITSIINKEKDVSLRNISIDSSDGIFSGFLIIGVSDTDSLNNIIKKIKTVKGIKDVQRSN